MCGLFIHKWSIICLSLPTVCLEHSLSHIDIFIIILCHWRSAIPSFYSQIQILRFHSFIPLPIYSSLLSLFYFPFICLISVTRNKSLKRHERDSIFPLSPSTSHSHKNEYFLLLTLLACWKLSLRDTVRYIFICFLSFWFKPTDTFQGRANVIYCWMCVCLCVCALERERGRERKRADSYQVYLFNLRD